MGGLGWGGMGWGQTVRGAEGEKRGRVKGGEGEWEGGERPTLAGLFLGVSLGAHRLHEAASKAQMYTNAKASTFIPIPEPQPESQMEELFLKIPTW